MQLVLKGKNFIISDRIREYVEKKITEGKVRTIGAYKVVQITLRANGTILRAEERGEAIYACIDAVAEKMHRQIVRYKGKRIDRWQGQTNKRRNDYSVMPELDPEVLDALVEEDASPPTQ